MTAPPEIPPETRAEIAAYLRQVADAVEQGCVTPSHVRRENLFQRNAAGRIIFPYIVVGGGLEMQWDGLFDDAA